jgi:hypothetical protein
VGTDLHGAVRFNLGHQNAEEEMDAALEAMFQIAATSRKAGTRSLGFTRAQRALYFGNMTTMTSAEKGTGSP